MLMNGPASAFFPFSDAERDWKNKGGKWGESQTCPACNYYMLHARAASVLSQFRNHKFTGSKAPV